MAEIIDNFEIRTEGDIVFEAGEPITVGEHGQHDFVYVEGEPAYDDGLSELAFEEGTGMSGGLGLDDYVFGNGVTAEVNRNAPVYEGERSLKLTRKIIDGEPSPGRIESIPGDGLPNYPYPGDTITMDMGILSGGADAGTVRGVFLWNFDSRSITDPGSCVVFTDISTQEVRFRVWENGSKTEVAKSLSHSLGDQLSVSVNYGATQSTVTVDGVSITRSHPDFRNGNGSGVAFEVGSGDNANGDGAKVAFDDCVKI